MALPRLVRNRWREARVVAWVVGRRVERVLQFSNTAPRTRARASTSWAWSGAVRNRRRKVATGSLRRSRASARRRSRSRSRRRSRFRGRQRARAFVRVDLRRIRTIGDGRWSGVHLEVGVPVRFRRRLGSRESRRARPVINVNSETLVCWFPCWRAGAPIPAPTGRLG